LRFIILNWHFIGNGMKNSSGGKFVVMDIDLYDKNRDIFLGFFYQQGCTGIEEISDTRWRVYFPPDFSAESQKKLENTLMDKPYQLIAGKVSFSMLESRDWLAQWKNHFKPVKVREKIWIAPPWEQFASKDDEITLIVDPQMAFGTGHHATTQLMIDLVTDYVRPGDSVMDAGTGSGILAILAAKLGAANVFGFDIEPEAIENARHNARLNDVSKVQFVVGDETRIPPREYQVILANINRNVLTGMLPHLFLHLHRDGVLILSGLLREDREAILAAAEPGMRVFREREREEWIGLVLKR
jgi:ribosomal protein L11 methyltransferase